MRPAAACVLFALCSCGVPRVTLLPVPFARPSEDMRTPGGLHVTLRYNTLMQGARIATYLDAAQKYLEDRLEGIDRGHVTVYPKGMLWHNVGGVMMRADGYLTHEGDILVTWLGVRGADPYAKLRVAKLAQTKRLAGRPMALAARAHRAAMEALLAPKIRKVRRRLSRPPGGPPSGGRRDARPATDGGREDPAPPAGDPPR